MIESSSFKVQGSGFRVQGVGFIPTVAANSHRLLCKTRTALLISCICWLVSCNMRGIKGDGCRVYWLGMRVSDLGFRV